MAISSSRLHEEVDAHGHDVDTRTFACPACRRAIATDGYCAEHRIGFVKGKAYFSSLTWHLGRGTVRKPAEIACAVCRKNAETSGWCDRDRVGMVGPFEIRDRAEFDLTVHEMAILKIADGAAKRCEHCAVAIITDTECPICRIKYK